MTSCKSSNLFIARAKLPRRQTTSKSNDVYNGMILLPSNIHTKKNELNKKKIFFINCFLQIHTHENVLVLKNTYKVD